MTQIVAADIGGTNARFALATIDHGQVVALGDPVTLPTDDFASIRTAWDAFARRAESPLPKALALSFAGPVDGAMLKLTNSPWVIHKAELTAQLGLDRVVIVNDFAAVAYAVSALGRDQFQHLCGPAGPLPRAGTTTVLGPGTGLGVAMLLHQGDRAQVIATEGGHIDFAPLDSLEDRLLAHLRKGLRRVSVERIVSGPGLANIYNGLAAIEARAVTPLEDKALWAAALAGTDPLAETALERLCLSFGAVAGDLVLAYGANAVVLAGSLGWRLRDLLPRSGFAERFIAKGRFERRMQAIPVKLVAHPQPGLFGAAVAFARGDDLSRT